MKCFRKLVNFHNIGIRYNDEKKLITLREEVNRLFFNHHLSKSMIAKKKRVARNVVIKWSKLPTPDFTKDARGWLKGRRRKWTKQDERRIKDIYQDLKENPQGFYTGATAIEQEWRRRYPNIPPLPLRTISQILKDLGLSKNRRKDRHKGVCCYLCYPEYTIYHLLGERVLETDFIGKKYIAHRTEPLNFIGFSFKKEPNYAMLGGFQAKLQRTLLSNLKISLENLRNQII